MADLSSLKDLGVAGQASAPARERKVDAQGRSYATGKRKNAVARVWVKAGSGKIIVNGKDYSAQVLKDAVTAAKSNGAPIEFLIKDIDDYATVKVDYHGGLKYPHLVRADGKDLIGDIAAPRK